MGAWSPHSGVLAHTPARCTAGRRTHLLEMQGGRASLQEVPAVSPNPSIVRMPLQPPPHPQEIGGGIQPLVVTGPARSPSRPDWPGLHLGCWGLISLDQRVT